MKASIASLVHNVAQNVSEYRLLHGVVPHKLDLTYITDRILAASECATASAPTYNDDGRTELTLTKGGGGGSRRGNNNSPADLSTFLQQRHEDHALILHLSDTTPDDRSLLLLRRQLLNWTWASPGRERSETPSLSQLLDLCYTLAAYLNLDDKNVVLVSCANGKTRSAIVIACFLKYAGIVHTSFEGFSHFLYKRCPHLKQQAAAATEHIIPPSLKQFFFNFDSLLDLGDYANPKPLLLRAVALQGVPVDDKPCLDIWDSHQRHVYSSSSEENNSQWAEEEGFYKVNRIIEGDFILLCRFGGMYAHDTTNDPSKVLFRYTNSTGFLSSGTYELPKPKVDMMRRYEASFDADDFMLTLILESYWDSPRNQSQPQLAHDSDALPEILCGADALERGWHLLTQHHVARPSSQDDASIRTIFPELCDCPNHILHLSLQLSNLDLLSARNRLCVGPMKEWWMFSSNSNNNEDDDEESYDTEMMESSTVSDAHPIRPVTPEPTCQDVLNILDDDSDTTDTRELPPRVAQHHDNNMTHRQTTTSSSTLQQQLKGDSIRYEPIFFPNRGDVVDAFGDYHITTTKDDLSHSQHRFPPVEPLRPRMPLHHKRKRNKEVSSSWSRSKKRNKQMDYYEEEEREAALKVLEQINHTGVTLEDLLQLQRDARLVMAAVDDDDDDSDDEYYEDHVLHQSMAFLLKDDKPRNKRMMDDDLRSVDTFDDDEDVEGFEVAGEDDQGPGKGDQFLGFAVKGGHKIEDEEEEDDDTDPALKNDPDYEKYFKMIKMGLPMEVVKHALKRDGKDPSIMDLDHNKSVKSQLNPPKKAEEEEVPIKNDPTYEKYFKMLKMGLPMDAVKHSMKRDGVDATVMDLDPNKSLSSQRGGNDDDDDDKDDGPPLKDDPEYSKYFKMLKMGLPHDAVKHSMKRDGMDPSVLDMDQNKTLKSQQKKPGKSKDTGPPLKDDPEYNKYYKMLKMGLPMGAVKNAIQRDGKDPSVMDLDPNKSLASQRGGGGDGDDQEELVDTGIPLKDDPEYSKYYKMLKMGLPIGAVKNAVQRDGKDGSVMDLDPNKSLKFQQQQQQSGGGGEEEAVDTGVPLKDDPEYAKYFKMMKMGLPPGAVKNALQRDGKDASIMDLDHDKSVAFQLAKKSSAGGGGRGRKKAKKRVRRKKIYWTPIDAEKVVEGSLWAMVKGEIDMEKLSYDTTEFENLFTESTNPADKKKKAAAPGAGGGGGGGSKKKEAVQIIDGKRSMNGGIILARVKIPYSKIADMVNIMDSGEFDSTQLKALKEFLPSDEERTNLTGYLEKGKGSKEDMDQALAALPECEKYMCAMMDVKNGPGKFDAMLFKVQFQSRLDELVDGIGIVKKACDEVRTSERLRKMMAMILTLVNQINTGGDGNLALGFNLEALLKLGEAKAFDKKTSVLHYLVKLIRQNDDTLLKFREDLQTVPIAEGVVLDGLAGDVKTLNAQLNEVTNTAEAEADALEKDGKLPPMPPRPAAAAKDDPAVEESKEEESKEEEKEESKEESKEEANVESEEAKEESKDDEGDNKMEVDEDGGDGAEEDKEEEANEDEETPNFRTPMEAFTYKARADVDKALKSLDALKENYSSVLKYFGEDENMGSNDFFGTLQKFFLEFKAAADHVDKIERIKLKEKLKKAAKRAANIKLLGDIAKADDKAGPSKPGEDEKKGPAAEKKRDDGKPDMGGLAAMAAAKAAKRGKPGMPDMGALAAAAAAKAGKRGSKTEGDTDGNATAEEAPSPGGIAAMAAAAAGKRPDMGGIAAMAAAAAAKRGQEKPEAPTPGGIGALAAAAAAKRNESKSEPPNMGGIAAMAAAAASKRGKDKGNQEAPSPGGIAAMAAAAAAKRNESNAEPPSAGGIAAMAAAAAAKRSEGNQEAPSPGGIAAMAAAAAAKRNESNAEPPSAGGIAEMAAAAAAKRSKGNQEAPSPGGIATMAAAAAAKRNEGKSEPSSVGGIAAMAAAAAAKRSKGNQEAPSVGGIAAMAAAAAAKRNKGKAEPPSVGGIAAMAAAAAAKRSKDKGNQEAPSSGGIAAMAAAAAAKRNESKVEPPSVGGIAAMAAAAAAKRNGNRTEPPSVGGIAAMAAAAAAKRNGNRTEPPSVGGIAAMAAAAAAKRNGNKTEPPSVGGVAAMAAAAALKRSNSTQDEQEAPNPGGVAVMAAAAAAKRNESKPEAPSMGGIAAMAAAAASKRNKAIDNQEAPNTSGIAAMAAASAKRNAAAETPPQGGGGIAAMAAAAAKRNATKEEISNGGGIAAMAAAEAAKRSKQKLSEEDSIPSNITAPEAPSEGGVETLAEASTAKQAREQQEAEAAGGVTAMTAVAEAKRNVSKSEMPHVEGTAASQASGAALRRRKKERKKALERLESGLDSRSETSTHSVSAPTDSVEAMAVDVNSDESSSSTKKRASFDDIDGDEGSLSGEGSVSSKKQKSLPPEDDGHSKKKSDKKEQDTKFADFSEFAGAIGAPTDAHMGFDDAAEKLDQEDEFEDSVHFEVEGLLKDLIKQKKEGPKSVESLDSSRFSPRFDAEPKSAESVDSSRYSPRFDSGDDTVTTSDTISVSKKSKKDKTKKEKKKKKKHHKKRGSLVRHDASTADIANMASMSQMDTSDRTNKITNKGEMSWSEISEAMEGTENLDSINNLTGERSSSFLQMASVDRMVSINDLASLDEEISIAQSMGSRSRSPMMRRNLTSLSSEAFDARGRKDSDDTFHSFFDTLDDEVSAVSGDASHSTGGAQRKTLKGEQPLDSFFKQMGDEVPKPNRKGSPTHPTLTTQESSDEEDDKMMAKQMDEIFAGDNEKQEGGAVQRFFKGLGASQEISENNSSSKGDDESSASRSGRNLFGGMLRQLSGQDTNSASSLPPDSPGPSPPTAPKNPTSTPSPGRRGQEVGQSPFAKFVKGLSMSPLDSESGNVKNVDSTTVSDLGVPSLSQEQGAMEDISEE